MRGLSTKYSFFIPSTLENPCIDSLYGFIYEFKYFEFNIFGIISLIGELAICRETWVVNVHSRFIAQYWNNAQHYTHHSKL